MTTAKDKYGEDGSGSEHEICEVCGLCRTCGDCKCEVCMNGE